MTFAFVLVECIVGLSSSAQNAVAKVQGVLESHEIRNDTRYGLVVKVHTEDEKQFKDTITALKNIAGIAAVTVSIVYGGTHLVY
jgi:nitrate reductase NapAB chaperone NapD